MRLEHCPWEAKNLFIIGSLHLYHMPHPFGPHNGPQYQVLLVDPLRDGDLHLREYYVNFYVVCMYYSFYRASMYTKPSQIWTNYARNFLCTPPVNSYITESS